MFFTSYRDNEKLAPLVREIGWSDTPIGVCDLQNDKNTAWIHEKSSSVTWKNCRKNDCTFRKKWL